RTPVLGSDDDAMFIVKLLHDKRWSHYDSSVQGKTDAVILTDTEKGKSESHFTPGVRVSHDMISR
ncbi:hypothetical protein JWG42_16100, partial [Desulfoprunum benzoelyticum]|uniref:hypothetical protein n=1 Tax=Desulfoprunum benzoelyticum TaxID=1506996 RepID=UPI00196456F6